MGISEKKKKSFNLKAKKDRALKSIAEVNCFLSNFSKAFTLKKIIKNK